MSTPHTYITLLYSCDAHHTHASKFLHGAFSSVDKAIEALRELIEKAKRPPISDEQVDLLHRIHQTQGYEGEGEFIIEPLKVDELDALL